LVAGMGQGGACLGFVLPFLLSTIHQVRLSLLVMAAVLLLSLVPVLWASRGEGRRPIERRTRAPVLASAIEFVRPLWTGDFGWVIFTRMMVSAGVAAVGCRLPWLLEVAC